MLGSTRWTVTANPLRQRAFGFVLVYDFGACYVSFILYVTHVSTFNTAIKFRIHSRDANIAAQYIWIDKCTIREFSSKRLILLHF